MLASISTTRIQQVRLQQSNYKPGTHHYLELQTVLDAIIAERFLIYINGERFNEVLN